MRDPELTAKAPKPFMERPLKLEVRGLLTALSKFAAHGITGQWPDALAELPDAMASIGLARTDEERLWTLIYRSASRAAGFIFHEFCSNNPEFQPVTDLDKIIPKKDSDVSFIIKRSFYNQPDKSEAAEKLKAVLTEWFITTGIAKFTAVTLADRFPSYFAAALDEEWRANSSAYDGLANLLESPFSQAAEREAGVDNYKRRLIKSIDEPIFAESFGIRQIFVYPRGYEIVERRNSKSHSSRDFTQLGQDDSRKVNSVVNVEERLLNWIKRRNKDDAIRVISGGPGSGKSSFGKMLAATIAAGSQDVLYVPLHQIDVKSDLKVAIGNFSKSVGLLENPIDYSSPDRPLILILDGLDELEMQGRAAQEASQQFTNDLVRFVELSNVMGCRLLVIVGGREMSVQAAEGAVKAPGSVIHLLPYYVPPNDRKSYEDPKSLLDIDQRDEWWNRYGKIKGKSYGTIPAKLKDGDIGDVTAQPLLNYLVALAHEKGDLKFDAEISVNSVYGDLLEAVHDRGWARNGHPAVRGIDRATFLRLLEEVAMAVWHGDGRSTTLREVENQCEKSGVKNLLSGFEKGAEAGVSGLLMAFYFRQKGRREGGDKTFEFTHKSFGEYLTSLRIKRAVLQILNKFGQDYIDPDDGWSLTVALEKWFLLFGPSAIDGYLFEFIRREMALIGRDKAADAQKALCKLYSGFLRTSWPAERVTGLTFKEANVWARNAEEALIACINACARVTKERSQIDWLDAVSFGEALKRIQGQRRGPANRLIHSCLSWMQLDGVCLDMADLYGANLSHSSLREADLNFTNLGMANIEHGDFTKATMLWTNIDEAQFKTTDFSKSMFDNAIVDREALSSNPTYRLIRDRRGPDNADARDSGDGSRLLQIIDPNTNRRKRLANKGRPNE